MSYNKGDHIFKRMMISEREREKNALFYSTQIEYFQDRKTRKTVGSLLSVTERPYLNSYFQIDIHLKVLFGAKNKLKIQKFFKN